MLTAMPFIVFCNGALAVDCTPADIKVFTQEEVDNFQANHGPGCDTVTGELVIGNDVHFGSYSEIENLEGLSALKKILGGLVIEKTHNLADLDALANVTTINHSLQVTLNSELTSLKGLASLVEFGGDIDIEENPVLTDMGSFTFDEDTVGSINIENCDSLAEIAPLEGITSINGSLNLLGTSLTSLSALSELSNIGGSFALVGNDKLVDVDDLENLTRVGWVFFLGGGNDLLENFHGLRNLEYVGSNFVYQFGGVIKELVGFDSLKFVGYRLRIEINAGLERIDAFNSLEQIGWNLEIRVNRNLTQVEGFDSLARVGNDFILEENSSLVHLNNFDVPPTIEGSFVIESNDALTDLGALSAVEKLGQSVALRENAMLENVDWLSTFDVIYNSLELYSNPMLSDLSGLANLTAIGDTFHISGSPNLEDLDDLSNLTFVGGAISIYGNDGLVSLAGLNNLDNFSGSVGISRNQKLTELFTLNDNVHLHSYSLYRNLALSDLSPLSGLNTLEGSLYIQDNPLITNLQGLNELESIGGSLTFYDSSGLVDLEALSNLKSVGDGLTILGNDQLKSLNGLQGVKHLNTIRIEENTQLTDISALSNIKNLGEKLDADCGVLPSYQNFSTTRCQALKITDNPALGSLAGLQNFESANGHVVIWNNPNLASCQSLTQLTDEEDDGHAGPGPGVTGVVPDVNGLLAIQDNHPACMEIPYGTPVLPEYCQPDNISLYSAFGFDNFQERYRSDPDQPCTKVVGDLTISPYVGVENLDGMSDLTFVGGNLSINGNIEPIDTAGLSNLEQVKGGLYFGFNPKIADLNGFWGLKEVGGDLVIDYNDELRSIASLANLESVGGVLDISNNPLLSDCLSLEQVLDHVDDGMAGPGSQPTPDVSGAVLLEENAEGCNSLEQLAPKPSLSSTIIGSWYDPERAGTGFMLHGVSDDLAIGYYYGFDKIGGRFWLIGVHEGPISWGKPIVFDANYVTGGTFGSFDSSEVDEQPWGEIELLNPTCNGASMTMTGAFPAGGTAWNQGEQTIRLAPTAGFRCDADYTQQPTDGLTGSWYDPETSGQGFAVHKVNSNTGVVYFYGFDDEGAPLWLIGVWDSEVRFGSQIVMQMNQVTGGTFRNINPDEMIETRWGGLRIRFDSCSSAWAELSGEDGTHEFALIQLAGSEGIECTE